MAKKDKKKKGVDATKALSTADLKHYRNTEIYAGMVKKLYDQAVDDLGIFAKAVGLPKGDEAFSFDMNKTIAKQVEQTITNLAGRIVALVQSGNRKEWSAACDKSDEFIKNVMGTSVLTEKTLQSYQDRNIEALNAFQERKVNGLNLSERVWMTVSRLKTEAELAVDTIGAKKKGYHPAIDAKMQMTKFDRAIGSGMSAAEFSREIRSCLLEPNKLFRRVRDKYGNLHLSKAAELYHPGQGVYRSSYKNAMRMTRSEINMAYRQSDKMRWDQLDFVVGFEVQLSNNHTCLGKDGKPHPFKDICDELAGKYPKDFKFVGWHPQCRCHAVPILQDRKEMMENRKHMDDPKFRPKPASNAVKDVPEGFKTYIKENYDRIEGLNGWKGWQSKPYYYTDNAQYVDKVMNPEKYQSVSLDLSIEEQKLLSDYEMYAFNHQGSKLFAKALEDAKEAVLRGDREAFDLAMAEMAARKAKNDASVASKAKKRAEITPEMKIAMAAQKRHEARTPEKILELTKFAEAHKAKTQSEYDMAMAVMERAKGFKGVDITGVSDILTGATNVELPSGTKANYSLEKLHGQATELDKKMDEIIAEARKLEDLIPNATQLLDKWTIEELQQTHEAIRSTLDYTESLPLEEQEKWLELSIKKAPNDLQRNAYENKLKEVQFTIRKKKLEERFNDIQPIADASSYPYFKGIVMGIEGSLKRGALDLAEADIIKAEKLSPLIPRYDAMVVYAKAHPSKPGKPLTKIEQALMEADQYMVLSKIPEALARIELAENTKAINEASAAAKKAAREAAKNAKEEEPEPEEEEKPQPKKKKLSEATSLDDVREIYGENMPKTLEELDQAVREFTNVSPSLKKQRDQVQAWIKEMIDQSDYGMAVKHNLLDSIAQKGFLNTFQVGSSQGYCGSTKTTGKIEESHNRLYAAHKMFNPSNKRFLGSGGYSRSYSGPQWERKDYEKYGHLLVKDIARAASSQQVWYGDVQFRFKKDKVCPTWTYDDSLSTRYQPSLCCDPKIESIDGDIRTEVTKADCKDVIEFRRKGGSGYFELQYHGEMGIDCVESLTFQQDPIKNRLASEKTLKAFANQGAKIYYIDKNGKVQQIQFETPEERRARIQKAAEERHKKRDKDLAKKGSSSELEIQKMLEKRAEEQVKARSKAEATISGFEDIVCKDIPQSEKTKIKKRIEKGDYLGAKREAERLMDLDKEYRKKEEAIKEYIPNAREMHKKFTMDELTGAYDAIKYKIGDLERRSGGDEEKFLKKMIFEADYIADPEHPERRKHSTWEIARDAYKKKADDIRKEIRLKAAKESFKELKDYKTTTKAYKTIIAEIENLLEMGDVDSAEALMARAGEIKLADSVKTKLVAAGVKFDPEAFSEERMNAVSLISGRSKQDGFNKADKLMSQYAEDIWAKMTPEEKHVAFLYTYGSKYFNEPLSGTRYMGVKYSPIDSTRRDPEKDINTLTEIIDKAKPLEKDMWVQHAESSEILMARFGLTPRDLRNLDSLAGKEAVNDAFFSTSCAQDSLFAANKVPGRNIDVVMNVYLPKGTKGLYTEPFAYWGDGSKPYGGVSERYQEKGYEWDGKSRLDKGVNAGDQVEFVLQRGSKMRIKKAEYKEGRWFVDVELVEQVDLEKFKYKY